MKLSTKFSKEIRELDHTYLLHLQEQGEIAKVYYDRIVDALDNEEATTANRKITTLTRQFLCQEIELSGLITQIDCIDQAYIKNDVSVPFPHEIRDKFCRKLFAQDSKLSHIPIEMQECIAEMMQDFRRVAAGKLSQEAFRKQVVQTAQKGIVKYSVEVALEHNWRRNLSSAIEWSNSLSDSISTPPLIRYSWEILLGEINLGNPNDRPLVNEAIQKFESLLLDFQIKFKNACRFVTESQHQEAACLFLELAHQSCPPLHILFVEYEEQEAITLPEDLKSLAKQGKYEELANKLGNVSEVMKFSQILQEVAKRGYDFIHSAISLLYGEDPYQILAKYEIYFNASLKQIKDLKIPETDVWNALRMIEKRLFIDWLVFPVLDPDFLRHVAEDAKQQLSMPGQEKLRELARPENLLDRAIILMVANRNQDAITLVEKTLKENIL